MDNYQNVDIDEWQAVADKCEYSTFFHTPAWFRVFTETYPNMKIATNMFILDNGTKVILPLMRSTSGKGFLSSYYSNIFGVYGGIIAEKKITSEDLSKIFNSIIKKDILSISIIGNPFYDYELPDKFKIKSDFTQVVVLNKSEKEITDSYNRGVKRWINKARKNGITCREAYNDEGEWKNYYSVYSESLKRWGKNATSYYPYSLFRNMLKTGNSNIKLWLVFFKEKIVGGSLNFYQNNHCVAWQGSFLSDYFKYGISNYLYNSVILDANRKGYKYYDFNPSGGHIGVSSFKDTFGTERINFKKWIWKSSFFRIISRIKKIDL
jgi:hypothetical protein